MIKEVIIIILAIALIISLMNQPECPTQADQTQAGIQKCNSLGLKHACTQDNKALCYHESPLKFHEIQI